MFGKKKQISVHTFVNVTQKLDNSECKPIVQPEQKQYTTKEFNNWHTYISKELKKLSYDRSNRKSKKQKEK